MLPALTPAYLERLISQPHRGEIEPADAAGEVGSVVGGSGVRVTLRFARGDGPRRIASARWRAFGSLAAIGPGSTLCERLVGCDDAGALAVDAPSLLRGFGGPLPAPVARAATHLLEATALALSESGPKTANVRAPGVLVCRCLGVGDRVIRHAIRGGALDVEAIGLVTSAGHGCHSCRPDLRAILDEETVGRDSSTAGDSPAAPLLERAIDALVRPTWRAQGVALGAVRVEGEIVLLSVASIERDALASPIGAVAIARHALRDTLSEGVRVELAPSADALGASGGPHVPPSRAR
jgi:bacterioferritin-associated ferredoxin